MLCFNCLEMLEMWSLKAGALQNLGLLEEADSEADDNRFYRCLAFLLENQDMFQCFQDPSFV